MLDQEWFIDVLTKKELAYLCTKFNINVQGFRRNLINAPEHKLILAIKEALNNGIAKKKVNAIVFEDMLEKIVKEVEKKCPYITKLTFEDFMTRAEIDSNIATYEIIAVTFVNFPDKYALHKATMSENLKNNQYIFHGLSKELSRPTIEKITSLMDLQLSKDETYSLLNRFEVDITFSDKGALYKSLAGKSQTEEETFKLLTEVHEKDRYLVLVAFLLYNDNYKEEKYNSLLVFSIHEVYNYYSQILKDQIKKEMNRSANYEHENKNLNGKIERLENDYKETNTLFTELEKEMLSNLQTLETVKIKHDKLDTILKQNEPLQMFFLRLVSENNFLIITKDHEEFTSTPLEGVTLSPTDFKKQLRTNPNHTFKNQVIFVTRVSFKTGAEWFHFKNLLEENELNYEELGHYDISNYVKEIIEYLNRKEILIYADEI